MLDPVPPETALAGMVDIPGVDSITKGLKVLDLCE